MIAEISAVPFFVAALLLVVAGIAKMREPAPLSRVLRALHLPESDRVVRLLAISEIGVGISALVYPSTASAVLVAALYTLFSAVLLIVRLGRIDVPSCGCLGDREAPVSLLHVGLNAIAVAAALVIAAKPVNDLASFGARLPLGGAAFFIGSLAIAYLCYAAVGYGPALLFAYQRAQPTKPVE